ALILTGFLFAALITEGRFFGVWVASASRYTTFDLLIPVGIYLALLSRRSSSSRITSRPGEVGGARVSAVGRKIPVRLVMKCAGVVMALIIVIQIIVSLP